MSNLIDKIGNQQTRDLAYAYSNNGCMKEDEVIFSMVYDFAKKLPYSMDIQQDEYVPADFLNMTPYDFQSDKFFKWEDSRTVYKAMTSWGDTFKSGILLQVCAVFQKMLSEQFPSTYSLNDDDFYLWGIDSMTSNSEYNKRFFETLKSLPAYYKRVLSAKTNEERRGALAEIYGEIENGIVNKIGGFRETDSSGKIVREAKPTIACVPSSDLKMLYYFRNIRYNSDIGPLKGMIKKQELNRLEKQKDLPKIELEGEEK